MRNGKRFSTRFMVILSRLVFCTHMKFQLLFAGRILLLNWVGTRFQFVFLYILAERIDSRTQFCIVFNCCFVITFAERIIMKLLD